MQAQKIMGNKTPSFAVTLATAAITTAALIGGIQWGRSRYPATDFSRPMLGEKTQASQTLFGHSSWVYTVAIAPDGETVASASYDGSIKIWHLPTGGLTRTIDAHPDPIASLAISKDGETLVSGSWDDCIKIWNLKTGNLTHTINTFADDVKAVAFSPDGQTFAAGTYSGAIKLWNSKTGEQIGEFQHSGPVTSAAISPDGKYLASGSRNGSIKIWQINTGWKLTIKGHNKAVWAVAFSPDGQTLASGGGDRAVKLWQVEAGESVSTFEGHSRAVYAVAFSPDGEAIASGSYDRQIRLWQASNGKLLETFAGHRKAVRSVGFTPDGENLVSGSADETVKIWSMSEGDVGMEAMEPPEVENDRREFFLESRKLESKVAKEISQLEELEKLNQKLYDRLDLNWRDTPQWYEDLVYRVKVNGDGAIANYEPVNQPAGDYVDGTPLPRLVDGTQDEGKSFAFFRVVMTPAGALEVSPWQGWHE